MQKKIILSDKEKTDIILETTKNNELKEVISHYSKNRRDSLKLEAAYFLIGNMVGKGSYEFKKNIDSNGVEYYTNPKFIPDIEIITSRLLIENIDYAFKSWKLPWAKDISFNGFKQLILPYRIDEEPLINWRKDNYDTLISQVERNHLIDRISITSFINEKMKRRYKLNNLPNYPGYQNKKEIFNRGGGSCNDLCYIGAYMFRSVGIPVTYEFTTYWGNGNLGGHSWLSILTENKKFTPLNPAFDNPVLDSLPFKGAHLAKVYRKAYAREITSPSQMKKIMSSEFPIAHYHDVTNLYVKVSNVRLRLKNNNEKVLLGVLNGLSWKPIETPIYQSIDSVFIKNIARNVLYILIRENTNKNRLEIISKPFFLSVSGKVYFYGVKKGEFTTIKLRKSRMYYNLYGKKCNILYWDDKKNRWSLIKESVRLNDNPLDLIKLKGLDYNNELKFHNIPSGTIYRVIDTTIKQTPYTIGRPFLFNPELNKYVDY